MRARQVSIICSLASLALAMVGPAMFAAVATGASPPTTYYLALGDSLSTGGGASPGMGYVNDIENRMAPSIPGLQLVDLGCGGDSTTRMINGGLCHNYTTGNQLGDAEAFLKAHPGQVAFVTIDVGGDDIVGCALSATINQTCVNNALAAVAANMQTILAGLRAAGGQVPIIGMNNYDPILAAWYAGPFNGGPPNPTLAVQSLTVLHSLNSELQAAYQQYGVRYADVASAFASDNWAMTGSYMGTTLPQNVANICNWTHMCMTGSGNPNIHTTNYGHSLIANAYESVMPPPSGIVVVLPLNGASLSGTQYLDAVPSPGVTQVQYELSGGTLSDSVIGTATPTIFGWIAAWNTTAVPNGTYTLQGVASYAGGVSATSPGVTITVNNAPPTTIVALPANGATVSGGQWLDASASPGVTSVNYVISGGPNNLVDAPISGSTSTYVGWLGGWNSTTVPNGTYTIQSVASYAGGVSATSPGVTITVNNAPPTTIVALPANGATVSGGQWLDASASPGVTSVNYVISGGPNNLVDAPISGSTSTYVGWLGGWNSTTVPNGTYTIQSVASYAGGVMGTSAPITITVSN